jgi:DNA polymerase-3 subunit delta'
VSLHPVYGHEELRERLGTSMRAGRLPTALLLAGPPGVGKQRLGLWIATGLLCERGPGEPCGECHSCHLAAGLSHPDLHWFFPIARPKGDEDRQVEEAEELLAQAVQARREQPLYPRPDGMAAIFLPLVRALHRRAQMRPAMGPRKVFVVGDAERLVPQASSPEAANALLKVLEEPPADTWFVLTAAEPAALLPTIRSRLVQLRVRRLRAAEVGRFLTEVPRPPLAPAEAARRAALAGGSIGAALAEGAERGTAEAAARELLEAVGRGRRGRLRYVFGIKAYGGRGDFSDTLGAAADLLRDRLAEQLRDPGAARGGAAGPSATGLLEAIREIDRARKLARGNVNPQLIAADLTRRLAERLQ